MSANKPSLLAVLREASDAPVPLVRWPWSLRIAAYLAAAALMLVMALYAAVVIGAGWLVFDYLLGHLRSLAGGAWAALGYVVPALMVLAALVLLVKPTWQLREPELDVPTLSRSEQPVLWEYITRISQALRVEPPDEIWVDPGVGAWASMRGLGLLGDRKRVVRLGLTLVRGLTVPMLVGVIAHELAHFVQQRGMWPLQLIERLNQRLVEAVYGRDRFDLWVEKWSNHGVGRVVLAPVKWCLAAGRRFLWVFMFLGCASTCLISRRVEYECDRCASVIVGSENMAEALQRIALFNIAENAAQQDLHGMWLERRLPDDLTAMVVARGRRLFAAHMDECMNLLRQEQTPWHATHPAIMERMAALERLDEPGMLHCEDEAESLFSGFDRLCRAATRRVYQHRLGDAFAAVKLIPVAELEAELTVGEEAQQAFNRYFEGGLFLTRPIFPSADATEPAEDCDEANTRLAKARDMMVTHLRDLNETMQWWGQSDDALRSLRVQRALNTASAGGVMKTASTKEINAALYAINQERAAAEPKLAARIRCLKERMTLALRLLHVEDLWPEEEREAVEAMRDRVATLMPLCPLLEGSHERLENLIWRAGSLSMMLQAIQLHPRGQLTTQAAKRVSEELTIELASLRESLNVAKYPFASDGRTRRLGDFVVPPTQTGNDMESVAITTHEALARADKLAFRVMAAFADIGHWVEVSLGVIERKEEPVAPVMHAPPQPVMRRPDRALSNGGWPALAAVMVIAAIGGVASLARTATPAALSHVPRHHSYEPVALPSPLAQSMRGHVSYYPPGHPLHNTQQNRYPADPFPPGHPMHGRTHPTYPQHMMHPQVTNPRQYQPQQPAQRSWWGNSRQPVQPEPWRGQQPSRYSPPSPYRPSHPTAPTPYGPSHGPPSGFSPGPSPGGPSR